MANIINFANVVDPTIQQPLTTGSMNFLQNNTKLNTQALVSALDPIDMAAGLPIRISGLIETPHTGTTRAYSAGYLYDPTNNEIFYYAGATGVTISTAPIISIVTSNIAPYDPLLFTDNVLRNVHDFRTITVADGTSGSGLWDYSATTAPLGDWSPITTAQYAAGSGYKNAFGIADQGQWRHNKFTGQIQFKGTIQPTVSASTTSIVFYLPVDSIIMNGRGIVAGAIVSFNKVVGNIVISAADSYSVALQMSSTIAGEDLIFLDNISLNL